MIETVMAIIVKLQKTAPGSPIFSRKFAVATIVLIIFVVYVSNLGKMMKVDSQVENIADEGNVKKFRFVAQLLINYKTSQDIHAQISTIVTRTRKIIL